MKLTKSDETMTLIQVQDHLIEQLKTAQLRQTGHANRTRRAAIRAARRDFLTLGFSDSQAQWAIFDAVEMAVLERTADDVDRD